MIDEQLQDQASLYIFGALEPEEATAFEARLAANTELQHLVDELRETAANIAHSAPLRIPPAHLEGVILDAIRSEKKSVRFPGVANWIPWAIAAGLALSTAWLYLDREKISAKVAGLQSQEEQARFQAAAVSADRDRAAKNLSELETRAAEARTQIATLGNEREVMAKELARLRERDSLAQMQIAMLTSKVEAAPRATAFVIWDAQNQRGVLTAVDVPPNAADHDYQLWVVDPKYQIPVDAGVFTVEKSGTTKISFKPKLRITSADAFAVSLERKGGVPKAEGPMVLVGK